MFSNIVSMLALASLALGAALPTPGKPVVTATKDVNVTVYSSDDCAGPGTDMVLDKDKCYEFSGAAKSLKVMAHGKGMKYNALNVYEKENCGSGPVLQPIFSDACSAVVAYKSIKVSVDTEAGSGLV